jgi:hypothetical protein
VTEKQNHHSLLELEIYFEVEVGIGKKVCRDLGLLVNLEFL